MFGLIFKKNKFSLDKSFLRTMLNSNIEYSNIFDLEEFNDKFFSLYAIDIFKPLLDVVLTKIKENELKFKILPMKSWDRVNGHCETATIKEKENESIFYKKNYTIIIRTIESSIIIHEIGHAIEHISEIDINKDFRKNLSLDTQNHNKNTNIQIKTAVVDVMQKQLKNYELKSTMPELFARFFELIAMSYEVDGFKKYQYYYKDVSKYFKNTIKWVKNDLTNILLKKIDKTIKNETSLFTKSMEQYEKKWASKSKFSKFKNGGKWTDNIESNTIENNREIGEIISSYESWQKDKEVQTLNNGVEYFEFGKQSNIKKLENKN